MRACTINVATDTLISSKRGRVRGARRYFVSEKKDDVCSHNAYIANKRFCVNSVCITTHSW